jgi:hypothetical protein
VSQSVRAKQEAKARLQRESEAAAQQAHAEVVASLKPEDLDWLKANGWEATQPAS